ncbi:MAG: DUF1552 domain-containing protein, partial [Planctomycetaceae bacterium]|nr:DUF1552 domain-containing protein [Planctomycetaceae bacterium]
SSARGAEESQSSPRRMVAIETNQGIIPQFFFPETAGTDYEQTPYLQRLARHRKQMTVFSGVSLPGVDGAHAAEKCFLTGTPHPARGGFKNGISLDQYAAERLGDQTRFSSLTLCNTSGNATLSFTSNGAPIPSESRPSQLFQKLFVQGNPAETEASVEALKQGRSLLDFVGDQSRRLNRTLPKSDQQRVDQYFTAVRDLEQRLASAEQWQYRPKPEVDVPPPQDITDSRQFVAQTKLMFDLIKLALETDSTRFISFFIDTTVIHQITHHGHRPEVIDELRGHEERQFDALNDFLTDLSESAEGAGSLLDQTQVLYGTCMGSANSHTNKNLPVLLAGGGFRHGQHLKFDNENNYPLSNLYVSMLQGLGIETDTFSTGRSTITGLEMS